MRSRSIFEIIESFRQGLRGVGSKFADFSNYSNIYGIYRSIAGVISSQEAELSAAKDGLFITSAKGNDLDIKAEDFGIKRKIGTAARGYVLVIVPIGEIPAGTILSTASNSLQYETEEIIASSTGRTEYVVPVRSLTKTVKANIEAGTNLYTPLYPNTLFVVGRYRNPVTKKVEGSIRGGLNTETDEELRQRIKDYLVTRGNSTIKALVQAGLSVEGVTRIYIKEHVPVTGYMTVYIDSRNIEVQREVERVINKNKAAGVCALIRTLDSLTTEISVEITIEVSYSSRSEELITFIKDQINRYVNKLGVGESLNKESIAGTVMRLNGVKNCRVIEPRESIVPRTEQIVEVENIKVTLKISR